MPLTNGEFVKLFKESRALTSFETVQNAVNYCETKLHKKFNASEEKIAK
jgi:hypothetical protein